MLRDENLQLMNCTGVRSVLYWSLVVAPPLELELQRFSSPQYAVPLSHAQFLDDCAMLTSVLFVRRRFRSRRHQPLCMLLRMLSTLARCHRHAAALVGEGPLPRLPATGGPQALGFPRDSRKSCCQMCEVVATLLWIHQPHLLCPTLATILYVCCDMI